MNFQTSFTSYLQPVNRNQKHFTDVPGLHPIPSNTVIDKTLTGFGATFSEISNRTRNSIIVMPNVAIIKAKAEKHYDEFRTLGVWQEITIHNIKEYLRNCTLPKKILTTPEGYKRVKKAISESSYHLFEDFFLLIDESHKLTKDAGYRDKITSPMSDFFLFKEKALISATPLPPSDPHFKQNGFRHIKVDPTYDYRRPLDVIHANNITSAVREYLQDHPGQQYFVFFNSINGIKALLENLNIKDRSTIFCSAESAKKLNDEGYELAYSELGTFSTYNFFTSSFYNGLDIELDAPEDILLITDAQAPNTFIDPLTDTLQILGRFRHPDKPGHYFYRKATHFFTSKWNIHALDIDEATLWLEYQKTAYREITALKVACTDSYRDKELNQLYQQVLERLPYHQFLKEGAVNHFRIDNFVTEERVKGYYRSAQALKEAYKVEHNRALEIQFKTYELLATDEDKINFRGGRRYSRENIRKMANIFMPYDDMPFPLNPAYWELFYYYRAKMPLMLQAYIKLGYEQFSALGFCKGAIMKAVLLDDLQTKRNRFVVIDAAHQSFALNKFYPTDKIVKVLSAIYKEYGVEEQARPRHLNYFFECKPYTKKVGGKACKGYIPQTQKQLAHLHYQRT